MTSMLSQFKKIDKAIDQFTYEFKFNIQPIIYKYYPNITNDEALEKLVFNYAMETFEFADSVINKDQNYSEERIKDEYKSMDSLISKIKDNFTHPDFNEIVHKKAKELIVNNFPKVMDLSAFGFLIMEKYTQLNFYTFSSSLRKLIEEEKVEQM